MSDGKRTVTWVHLSDLHLSKKGALSSYQQTVIKGLIEDIKKRSAIDGSAEQNMKGLEKIDGHITILL